MRAAFLDFLGTEPVSYTHLIQEALNTGVIAGFPVLDVKVTLFDGSYHEVDSSEAAFKIAGSMAIKDALKKSCLLYTSRCV